MPLAVLLWLSSAIATEPAPTGDPSADPPAVPDTAEDPFTAGLREAKRSYFEGRTADALEAFQRLEFELKHSGGSPAWSEATEAMTYLGELYLLESGDADRAAAAFRWILERDLDTPMRSPYHHPIEVVNLFEDVRDAVTRERNAAAIEPVVPPAERRRPPWWTFAPLGLPQLLGERRPVAGITFGVLQIGLIVTTKVTNDQLVAFNVDPGGGPAELADFRREYWLRRGVQNTSFGLIPVTWFVSILDAQGAWRKKHRQSVAFITPGAGHTPGLTIHGRL